MTRFIFMSLLLSSLSGAVAFLPASGTRNCRIQSSETTRVYGLLDDLQLIFSDEGKKNRAAYEARERAEQEAAQREILERRRNQNKMEEYNEQVASKRQQLQEERNVWGFQQNTSGDDPLK